MRRARDFAEGTVSVELVSQQYVEDEGVAPSFFKKMPNLTRSISDIYTFKYPRKLPLIADLLNVTTKSDYIIYTNVDIAVMPHFYCAIAKYIEMGYDAIAINRRTINAKYKSLNDLSLMYEEVGKPHEGIDCFVLPKNALEKYNFFDAFIGSGPVGLCFVANMIIESSNFLWLEDKHLTFHLGDDKAWSNPAFSDYQYENFTQLKKICTFLLENRNMDTNKNLVIHQILEDALNNLMYLNGDKSYSQHIRSKVYLSFYSKKEYDNMRLNHIQVKKEEVRQTSLLQRLLRRIINL